MIFGVLVGHRSYPLVKYLIVLLIVAGVALFLFKDGGASRHGNGDEQWRLFHFVGIGELLVVSGRRGRVKGGGEEGRRLRYMQTRVEDSQ